jgi:hypothetical protein
MDVYLSLINGVINAKKHMKWDNGAMQVCWCLCARACACMPQHASVELVSVDCICCLRHGGKWDKLAVHLHSCKAFFCGMPWPSAHACMAVFDIQLFQAFMVQTAPSCSCRQLSPGTTQQLLPTHAFSLDCVLTLLLRMLSRPFSCTFYPCSTSMARPRKRHMPAM